MGEEEFVKNYDENHGREWNANKKKMIPKDEFDEVRPFQLSFSNKKSDKISESH